MTKPTTKKKRIVLPKMGKGESADNFAYAVLRATWLAQHPGKTAEDFDAEYARQKAETESKKKEYSQPIVTSNPDFK